MSAELLARARAGDRAAFTALVEPHRGELQAHCYRMLGSLQDAEDALQETLLAALQSAGRFAGRASERTWLTTILKNKVVDRLRRRQAVPGRGQHGLDLGPEEEVDVGERDGRHQLVNCPTQEFTR